MNSTDCPLVVPQGVADTTASRRPWECTVLLGHTQETDAGDDLAGRAESGASAPPCPEGDCDDSRHERDGGADELA